MKKHLALLLPFLLTAAAPAAATSFGAAAAGTPGLRAWQQSYHEARAANPGWPALPDLMATAGRPARPGEIPLALLCKVDTEGGALLAAAALRPVTHRGRDARFVLRRGNVFCGGGEQLRSVAIDPGDGAGWRPLPWGRPVAARFDRPGDHEVRLRAVSTAGATLETSLVVRVAHLETPLPSDTLAVTATVPYAGDVAGGRAYVYLAPGRLQIARPVVVLEGLDLDNSMGWDEFYWLLNQQGLLEELRAGGWDAVVLDFTDATTYLQRNAFLAVELLQQVAAITGPSPGLALVGASMGGVVGRYALAWMERQGLPHGVGTYISFDAPHGGGNVPLGLQYWVGFFADRSAEAAFMQQQLQSPAARQLLLYHATDPPSSTPAADPLRAAFLAELAALGGYPAQPRLCGLANGSGVGLGQGYAAGAQLIRYEYYSLLVDIVGNVWALPDGGPATIFQGVIDQIWPLPDTRQTVTVSGTAPWDNAPGGWRPSMAQMDTVALDLGDIVALQSNHCFVPTVSALDLAGVGPFHDLAADPDLPARTPFASFFWPAANEEHMTITPGSAMWLEQEIRGLLVSVGPGAGAGAPPAAPVLQPNVPNPFNPATIIAFALPAAGLARLEVVTPDGRIVRRLLDGPLPAGSHAVAWDGADARGRAAPSGVYFYRLSAAGKTVARKMALVR